MKNIDNRKVITIDAKRSFYLEGKIRGKKVYIFDEIINHPDANQYHDVVQSLFYKIYEQGSKKISMENLNIFLIPISTATATGVVLSSE